METNGLHETISNLLENLLTQVESLSSREKCDRMKISSRTLRSHVRKRFHSIELYHQRQNSQRRRIEEKKEESTDANKSISIDQLDLNRLPPNKRRLRERQIELNAEKISACKRHLPLNSIEQYLQIRQQINKRHGDLLRNVISPKIPPEFAQSRWARQDYLIASSSRAFPIERLATPVELDGNLAEIFVRQEDERYRMKLRHQVERDKLILSHEQEILRLYGNSTRYVPISYCSLLKDTEIYQNIVNDSSTKSSKTDGNIHSLIEDSNLKYHRLSCEMTRRHEFESHTLHAVQRMIWSKYLSKELSRRLSDRYVPRVEICADFSRRVQWKIS